MNKHARANERSPVRTEEKHETKASKEETKNESDSLFKCCATDLGWAKRRRGLAWTHGRIMSREDRLKGRPFRSEDVLELFAEWTIVERG